MHPATRKLFAYLSGHLKDTLTALLHRSLDLTVRKTLIELINELDELLDKTRHDLEGGA